MRKQKGIQIIAQVICGLILLLLLVTSLFYIPFVQTATIPILESSLSTSMGMDISIGSFHLGFPFKLKVGDFCVSQKEDTLFFMGKGEVMITPLSFGDKSFRILPIQFKNLKVNSGDFITTAHVKGTLKELNGIIINVSLTNEDVEIGNISAKGLKLTTLLLESKADTTPPERMNWHIRLKHLNLTDCQTLTTLTDQSVYRFDTKKAEMNNLQVLLGDSLYALRKLRITDGFFALDTHHTPPLNGLDPNHLEIHDITTEIDSLSYQGYAMQALVKQLSMQGKSGWHLKETQIRLKSDAHRINLSPVKLVTEYSKLDATIHIPWKSITNKPQDRLTVEIDAKIGPKDILALSSKDRDSLFVSNYPDSTLWLSTMISGNRDFVVMHNTYMQLPGALRMEMEGEIHHPMEEKLRKGSITFSAHTDNANFLLSFLPPSQQEAYHIPRGLSMQGHASIADTLYKGRIEMNENGGNLTLLADYHPHHESYQMKIRIDSLSTQHFVKHHAFGYLTAQMQMKGQHVDPFSQTFTNSCKLTIDSLVYGKDLIQGISLDANFAEKHLNYVIKSTYPKAKITLYGSGSFMAKDKVTLSAYSRIENLDLENLGFTTVPLHTSFQFFTRLQTDLKNNHDFSLAFTNWKNNVDQWETIPSALSFTMKMTADSTQALLKSGDLELNMEAQTTIDSLSLQVNQAYERLLAKIKTDSTLQWNQFRTSLPQLQMNLHAGRKNLINDIMRYHYMNLDGFTAQLNSSTEKGFQMECKAYGFQRDTFRLDTLQLQVAQDSFGITYNALAFKKPYRNQKPFTANLSGVLQTATANLQALYFDTQEQPHLKIDLQAQKTAQGFTFHLNPDSCLIGSKVFQVNKNNYLLWDGAKTIKANLLLSNPGNGSFRIYSNETDSLDHTLRLELAHMDLSLLSKSFDLPSLKGIMSIDAQYEPLEENFFFTSSAFVDSLFYEGDRVGEILASLTYLPMQKSQHRVDLHLFRDQKEINTLSGTYNTTNDNLTAEAQLIHFPLEMLSPFVPHKSASFKGTLSGLLTVKGKTTAPLLDGEIKPDSISVYFPSAQTTVRFENQPITLNKGLLNFNAYKIYTVDKKPFIINGTMTMTPLTDPLLELELTANQMKVMDAPQKKESILYGKLLADMNTHITGHVSHLKVKSQVNILGETNLTYVMDNSPLEQQDQLKDLVEFTSFTDTFALMRKPYPALPLGGMDLLMSIHIDPSVRMSLGLSNSKRDGLRLFGGGNLSFTYNPSGDMYLNGKYELMGGEIKYNMPIVGYKKMDVERGSFVKWTGDPMNPTLNIHAYQTIISNIKDNESNNRRVEFNAGMKVTNTLEDMALAFTASAPNDAVIQSELSNCDDAELNKQAVSLLLTGIYLNSNQTGLDMGSAINSYLSNQISNIAGDIIGDVDLSLNMESKNDYSFRFSKRFIDDRLRIIIGGGNEQGDNAAITNQEQSFIDKIAAEYQLDNKGRYFIKLFYEKNYENLLEGELNEAGAGILMRKSVRHFCDFFRLKQKTIQIKSTETEKK